MKGSVIDKILRGVEGYGEVLSIDQLHHLKRGKMYIVNTKPSYHPGEHWIVIDRTKKQPYLFDSFGKTPKFYGLPKMTYWKRHLQHPDSNTCGIYSMYYIVQRSRHYSPEYMFEQYGANRTNNDRKVQQWLKNRLQQI